MSLARLVPFTLLCNPLLDGGAEEAEACARNDSDSVLDLRHAMSLLDFLADPAWDKPFFKALSSNDTGEAAGHQGGMVIPRDLRSFFPGLVGTTSAQTPTIDHRILADLYEDERLLSRANTRYQFQTWGGTRTPESRLTDGLAPIRNKAVGGDILIVQRNLADLELYRLVLVKKSTPSYALLKPFIDGRRWGVLGAEAPMSEADYKHAEEEESAKEAVPFKLFDPDAKRKENRTVSIARSIVFRNTLQRIYDHSCAVCGSSLRIPNGPSEMHAAHIVPRARKGSDDARNGLGLCRTHHWAFDAGLFGVDSNRKIWAPLSVIKLPANRPLALLLGSRLREAKDAGLRADPIALEWHLKNIVLSD